MWIKLLFHLLSNNNSLEFSFSLATQSMSSYEKPHHRKEWSRFWRRRQWNQNITWGKGNGGNLLKTKVISLTKKDTFRLAPIMNASASNNEDQEQLPHQHRHAGTSTSSLSKTGAGKTKAHFSSSLKAHNNKTYKKHSLGRQSNPQNKGNTNGKNDVSWKWKTRTRTRYPGTLLNSGEGKQHQRLR